MLILNNYHECQNIDFFSPIHSVMFAVSGNFQDPAGFQIERSPVFQNTGFYSENYKLNCKLLPILLGTK